MLMESGFDELIPEIKKFTEKHEYLDFYEENTQIEMSKEPSEIIDSPMKAL